MVVCGQASASVGQPKAPTAASRDMRFIPVGDDGYPIECMTCPQHAQALSTGVLGCPICDSRFFYTEMRPPRVNILSNPAARKQVGVACYAYNGITKSKTLVAKFEWDAGKLVRDAQKWDASGSTGETDAWPRERSQFGCCRLRNTCVIDPWAPGSPDPPGTLTLTPHDSLLFFLGTFWLGGRTRRNAREDGRAPGLRTRQ